MHDRSSGGPAPDNEDEAVDALAAEAQRLVHDAAKPVRPGETIKGQIRRAARALGYPAGSWRIRAAWYGEAGCWTAAALEDLRGRYRAWGEKKEREARTEAAAVAARLGLLRDALAEADPDRSRPEVHALCRAIDLLRSRDCSVADPDKDG